MTLMVHPPKLAPLGLIFCSAISLCACGQSSQTPPSAPAASPESVKAELPAPVLTDGDLGRVCRGAIAALNGRDPGIIKVETVAAGVAQVAYSRPDDGKRWKNQCRVVGNRVTWAAVDLSGPGTGPGRWRIDPADETVTYSLVGSTVKIRISYSDGSGAEESYTID